VPVYYTIKPSSAYPYMGLLFVATVPGSFMCLHFFFVFLLTADLNADRVYIVYNNITYYSIALLRCTGTVEVTGMTGITIT